MFVLLLVCSLCFMCSCWVKIVFVVVWLCRVTLLFCFVPPHGVVFRVVFVVFVSGLFFVSGLNVFLVFCCVCLCGSCLMVFV